ncbi:MAG: hypothetical protein ACC661_12420, partial [Verrucomicrobiales bacterium]
MRKFLIVGLVVLVIAGVGLLIARQVLVGYLTPDFLTPQTESRWNCRVQIDAVKVTLLGSSATVTLEGVALAPRDDQAGGGLPLAERTPLAEGTAELRCESVLLEILPAELIKRQLNGRQLVVHGLGIATTINEDGDVAFERLFDQVEEASPLSAAAETNVDGAPSESPTASTEDQTEIDSEDSFAAGDLVFAMVAERVEIKDGQFEFLLEASGTRIVSDKFQIAFSKIDIDPSALDSHNRADFQFGGDIIVRPAEGESDEDYLAAHVSGAGRIAPFNQETGLVDPVWSTDLTMFKGAQINTFPVIGQLQKLLDEIDTAGVDLSGIKIRGTLLADARTKIGHAQGRYLLKSPLELPLPDTLLVIQKGSWLHSGTNQHKMRGTVVASEPLTRKVESMVDAYLKEKAGNFASEQVRNLVLSPVMKENRL